MYTSIFTSRIHTTDNCKDVIIIRKIHQLEFMQITSSVYLLSTLKRILDFAFTKSKADDVVVKYVTYWWPCTRQPILIS